MRFVEIAPNRWRFVRDEAAPARSSLPCPYIISDTMDPVEQVDGIYYTSKARFRAVGRALGLTEVGTEKFKPKRRTTDTPEAKKKRRESLQKAIARYRSS